MRQTFVPSFSQTVTLILLTSISALAIGAEQPITIHKRSLTEAADGKWVPKDAVESWLPQQTAIIVCDMWDSHHCLNAVRRAVEMSPRMNSVLATARDKGVLIIHAPSSCMDAYRDHPGRKLAQSAPKAGNLPLGIGEWCYKIPPEEKGVYPLDQKEGGEDDDLAEHKVWHEKLAALGRKPGSPWKSQISLLTMNDKDAISDSGTEIWNLLESRGIKNVVVLGVHTNMCVLGRPFGLRQLSKNGKNVVLMRDMTDTMYDPSKWPFVSHFTGTRLIVEHIEKYVCPTITSVDLRGGKPFQFSKDRNRVAILIGDDEYKTEITLPEFVKSDLEPLGFQVTIVHSDSQDKNNFPGMAEAIRAADVVLVSVRRRMPPKAQLDALREHFAAGKPIMGIRTACHAWCMRDAKQNEAAVAKGQSVWPEFDPEVFGGHYTNHHGDGPKTQLKVADAGPSHAVLRGLIGREKWDISTSFQSAGSLYKVRPLTDSTTTILIGSIPNQDSEPVAWTNRAGPKQAKVFNTTLGHPDDFKNPAFRKLLVNALFWALESPYADSSDIDGLLPKRVN